MKYYSKETLLDRYEKLPQELKGAIFAQVNTDNLLKIGRNNNLTFDQIGAMARETGYVILGITHPARFVYKLKESLNIDTARANIETFFQFVYKACGMCNAENDI